MGLIRPFDGIPKQGIRFLADLAQQQNRDWFEARRETYQTQLLEPLQRFVDALGLRLQQTYPQLDFDPAANGSGSLTRIYRDTRFSKDKSPYKSWMGMRFWHGPFGKKVGPGFFVSVSPEGVGLYAGVWHFDKPILEAWREWVDRGYGMEELARATADLIARGVTGVGGLKYKRVPRGFDKDHPRAELLKHDGLYAILDPLPARTATSAQLVETCAERFEAVARLHAWLVEFYEQVRAGSR
ncbi:MAG: hypothetical protein CMJ94_06815 [Planctomycetes bacterium]|nr:hypothetical protein [Planctomycetota bacterium]